MISGEQPETAIERIRAKGSRPFLSAKSSVVIKVAAAPSHKGDDVPAVTVPVSLKAGFNAARASLVVSSRMQPSVTMSPALP